MFLGNRWGSRRAKGQPRTSSQGLQLAGALHIVVSSGLQIVHLHQYSVMDHIGSEFMRFTIETKTYRQILSLVAWVLFFYAFLIDSGASLIKHL